MVGDAAGDAFFAPKAWPHCRGHTTEQGTRAAYPVGEQPRQKMNCRARPTKKSLCAAQTNQK
jgi:hypothetical protein